MMICGTTELSGVRNKGARLSELQSCAKINQSSQYLPSPMLKLYMSTKSYTKQLGLLKLSLKHLFCKLRSGDRGTYMQLAMEQA